MTAVSSPKARYFTALDAFRGLCALMVAAGHLATTSHLSKVPMLHTSVRWVDFFFVLSGFVITHSARDALLAGPRAGVRFLLRRFGRIWPLHVFVLLLVVSYEVLLWFANHKGLVVEPVAFSGKTNPAWLPANLAMIQAWHLFPSASWNVPAWSISAEFAAYLLFAAAMMLLRRHGTWLVVGVGAVCGGVMVATAPRGMVATFDIAVLRCWYGFGTGVLVHWLWQRGAQRGLPAATALEAVAFVAGFGLVTLIPEQVSWSIVPVFAVVIWIFAHEQGAVSRWFSGRLGKQLGERSFSIYLLHAWFVVMLLSAAAVAPKFGVHFVTLAKIDGNNKGLVGSPWLLDGVLLAYLAVITVMAGYTYRWLESPARSYFGRLAQKIR